MVLTAVVPAVRFVLVLLVLLISTRGDAEAVARGLHWGTPGWWQVVHDFGSAALQGAVSAPVPSQCPTRMRPSCR